MDKLDELYKERERICGLANPLLNPCAIRYHRHYNKELKKINKEIKKCLKV
jgi:hypothetical protein